MDPAARARISEGGPLPCALTPESQALTMSDRSRLGPARGLQLAEDVRYVHADGLRRDEQFAADLPVAGPGREQRQNLTLALGQSSERTTIARASLPLRAADPGAPAKVGKHSPERSGSEQFGSLGGEPPLRRGSIAVPVLGQRLRQAPARAGGLVHESFTESVHDRLPARRGVVAVRSAVLRLSAGEPAAAVDPEREPWHSRVRRAGPGYLEQPV